MCLFVCMCFLHVCVDVCVSTCAGAGLCLHTRVCVYGHEDTGESRSFNPSHRMSLKLRQGQSKESNYRASFFLFKKKAE